MEIDIDISTIPGILCRNIHRRKVVKYGKYANAISPHLAWLKNSITNAKDGIVRVKTVDIAKEMGSEFTKKRKMSVYWGLKYTLFKEGIVVDIGIHNTSDDDMLIMRLRQEDDILPPSLAKCLESEDKKNQPSESLFDNDRQFAANEKTFDATKFNIDDIFKNM